MHASYLTIVSAREVRERSAASNLAFVASTARGLISRPTTLYP